MATRRGGNRGGGSSNRRSAREEVQEIIDKLKTAADLMGTAATGTSGTASAVARALEDNKTAVESLKDTIVQAFGDASHGVFGPQNGVRPLVNQARPNGFPGGVYPGYGGGYGTPNGVMAMPGAPYGSLRHAIASQLNQQLGSAGLRQVPTGEIGPNGEPVYKVFHGDNPTPIFHGTPSESRYHPQLQRRFAIGRAAAGLEGSGMVGLARNLPGVGTALVAAEGVYDAAKFIGSQQAANAQYQSIYGGSNMAGMGQRFEQEGFKLRNIMRGIGSIFGGSRGLTGSDADAAFKAVSAMGYQGHERNTRLDFITGNYTSMGMSVDESIQLVAAASKTLTTSLQDLHVQLKQVSDMAQQTGQNADLMRQSFIANFAQNSQIGFGASSGIISQAETAASAGMGRAFSGIGYGGMTSSLGQLGITGSYMGYANPGAFVAASANNPMIAAEAMQKRLNVAVNGALSPTVRQQMEQRIRAAGGYQALQVNNGLAQQIGMEFADQINPYQVVALLQTMGITGLNPADIQTNLGFLVMQVAASMQGPGSLTEGVQRQIEANNQRTPDRAGQAALAINGVFGGGDNSVIRVNGQLVQDPVIRQITSGLGGDGLVQVQTKDGPQVVTVDTASKYYRDQLANGTALIASGQNAGLSVKSVYGQEYNAHYANTTTRAAAKGGQSIFGKDTAAILGLHLNGEETGILQWMHKLGFSAPRILQAAQKMQATSGGSITITMQPELAKYLGIQTTGDLVVNQGAAANSPPLPPNPIGSPTGH